MKSRYYRIISLCVLLFCSVLVRAQYPEGERLFANGEYEKAEKYYASQLKQNPSSMTLRYRVGRCQLLQQKYVEAFTTLEPLKQKRNAPKELYQLLGEALYNMYRFSESQEAYEHYVGIGGTNNVDAEIRKARSASVMLHAVDDITILDSVVVDKDKLLSVYALSSEIGTLYSESNDSLQLIGCISGRGDSKVMAMINDSVINLYESYKLLDGKWSTPSQLKGAINTEADENYPFIHPDGVTIYFASKGHNSLGGYDIYYSSPNSNGYLEPKNVGFPFNSFANDYLLVIDEYAGIGWFATDRRQPQDKVMVYTFIPNKQRKIVEESDERCAAMAQLLTYTVGDKNKYIKKDKKATSSSSSVGGFVINDVLIYSGEDDFLSDSAREYYKQYTTIENDIKQTETQLNNLRNSFVQATSDNRAALAREIQNVEELLLRLNRQLKDLAVKTRNAELQYLLDD